ncbi:uncharacterized protein [Triticum aestivum]|uniref:uncharacterized protein n=1 Tax=Triticum aestivum TaxID=4565 RepID=UPI001D029903|nr:uncharacterized protein LOC123127709 [Triticum aestivum]XP_044403439.1 uncharacterized protein LOC123127709 [Triticum aestivum]XP_044403440.1 uncharacterized protein LOC123127709 [Triticum aestivum]XP_044403441.1 uncharacterized protein LOC123127709 [Triticum aestivum]
MPNPPTNAHVDSLKTIADFPKEVDKRAKAAKRNEVEQRNLELTQQDVQEKKDRAFARKRKFVSPQASIKKSVARESKKAASASESSDENAPKEISMYNQRALLDKPYQTRSPAKVSPPFRMSPRLAPAGVSDPSGSAAPSAKIKLLPEEKAIVAIKKAKSRVPASTKEQKHDFEFMIDLVECAAYDAKSADLSSLDLPDDVIKLVAKHFTELGEITKELNQAVEDMKTLEQMRRDACIESERKSLNKEILELTKALTVMRNNKIEWHTKLKMDISQLCDRRHEEIERQVVIAR